MTIEQNYLISLLTSELSGAPPELPGSAEFDWNEFFRFAKRHDLLGAIYPAVEQLSKEHSLGGIMTDFKNCVLCDAAEQAGLVEDLLGTLRELDAGGVRYVLFKGLVLKGLYPRPELRSMGDADLFVKEDSFPAAEELMKKLEYAPVNVPKDYSAHLEMARRYSFCVELHHTLWKLGLHDERDTSAWEKHIWEHVRRFDYEGVSIPALSVEDEFINLVLHFSTHFVYAGVNLRQIFDIALFLKKYEASFDWDYVNAMIESLGLTAFLLSLLAMYRDCFGLFCASFPLREEHAAGRELLEDLLTDYGIKKVEDYVFVTNRIFSYHKQFHIQKTTEGFRRRGALRYYGERISAVLKMRKPPFQKAGAILKLAAPKMNKAIRYIRYAKRTRKIIAMRKALLKKTGLAE